MEIADDPARAGPRDRSIARLGGDEFAVLLPQADAPQASAVAEKLVRAVREHRRELGGRVGATTHQRRRRAVRRDPAQRRAAPRRRRPRDVRRQGGRPRRLRLRRRAQRVSSQTKARLAWLDRIREALAENRFTLLAQPILDLDDRAHRAPRAAAADDRRRGELIAPACFLEIAERFGAVADVDVWVVREAIRKLAEHRDEGLVFEVNLSGSSIGSDRLLETIETDLAATGVDPRR